MNRIIIGILNALVDREGSHFFKKLKGCAFHDGGPLGDVHDLATPCRDSPLIWRSTRRKEEKGKSLRKAIGGDGERAGREEVGKRRMEQEREIERDEGRFGLI